MENENGEIGKLVAPINPFFSFFFRAWGLAVDFTLTLLLIIGAQNIVELASVFHY